MANKEDGGHEERLTEFFNTLLFETPSGQRFTQDSPILANVWLAYARNPCEPQDLILTVKKDMSTGKAAQQLRQMLDKLRGRESLLDEAVQSHGHAPALGVLAQHEKEAIRMAYLPGQIAVRLYFDELMRVVLPSTPWWSETIKSLCRIAERYQSRPTPDIPEPNSARSMPNWMHFPIDSKGDMMDWIIDGLMLMRRGIGGSVDKHADASFVRDLPNDFIWLIRIGGILAHLTNRHVDQHLGGEAATLRVPDDDDPVTHSFDLDFEYRDFKNGNTVDRTITDPEKQVVQTKSQARVAREQVARAFFGLYENWKVDVEQQPEGSFIWRVTKNRTAELAVYESSLTVKADAARRLFNISCKDITWAIVDSGIDTSHPAFKDAADEDSRGPVEELPNRIVRTLDFTNLRDILDPEVSQPQTPELEKLVDTLVHRRMADPQNPQNADRGRIEEMVRWDLENLHKRILRGHDIDWETLEPLITDHSPKRPGNDHGTHVAGILGADWVDDSAEYHDMAMSLRPRKMQGTCPEIRLIDCRVFRDEGDTDEFEILAAIQFLRWLNSRAGYTLVHGANLSLSLLHEVRRFACGQTPICVECNEASALGMVIVAAAGNRGYEMDGLHLTGRSKGFRAINITDPGNADGVITVGATHRKRPHEYGVSYFSSRGPTGDGRVKPDLVAPGEKIKGPTPDGRAEYKDGTSMAAPHVSGAAAMLMSRHKELCGKPARIKEILCETATDLGRDRYFQGHGLLDILRALQSI